MAANLAASGNEVIRIDIMFGFNVLNYGQLSKVPEFNLVVHLASCMMVAESYTLLHTYYKTNEMGKLKAKTKSISVVFAITNCTKKIIAKNKK